MKHQRVRRSSVVTSISAAALVAAVALPAAAPAAVSTTSVTVPSNDAVFDGVSASPLSGIGNETTTVSGVAPGAADGDRVTIVCSYTANGVLILMPLGSSATIEGGAFSATVQQPAYTCRLRAVPIDFDYGQLPEDTDLSAYAGPRVLGGSHFEFTVDDPGQPFDGAQVLQSTRGQGKGLVLATGMASSVYGGGLLGWPGGGLYASVLIDDTYWRTLFGPSALLGGFGAFGESPTPGDVADAGLLVDGRPAMIALGVGDERSQLLSRTVDPVTGDLTFVESAPIALIAEGEPDAEPTLTPSGLRVERSYRQDHEGRQITIGDVFRSTDGAAHRIEARYTESLLQEQYGEDEGEIVKEPASFRLPWATGEDYVVPKAGDSFGAAPPGATTIWVHGPRLDFSTLFGPRTRSARPRAAGDGGLPARAEGAFTFDAPPTDVKFLSPGVFVARFVRDVPAGGTASVGHVYSQDLTPAGLDDLVDGDGGTDVPAPPATTPLPTEPGPAPPPLCALPFASLVDIQPAGTSHRPRVRLVGAASPTLAGRAVEVRRDGRRVGSARVRADGTIQVTVAAPKGARARAKARYRLLVGPVRSQAAKATRQAIIIRKKRLAGGRISVSGQIRGAKRARTLRVTGTAVCGSPGASTRTIRVDRHGRFRVTLTPPTGAIPGLVYRIQERGRTSTLPVLVTRP